MRVVFYKAAVTNKTAYAGVTGYGVYAVGTTVPLTTTGVAVPAPLITTQPTNQTVYLGSNVSMVVVASGTGLGYQWRRSNTNLPGANSSLYSIPNVQTNHSGSYTVVVTNSGGGKTSDVAVLTVLLPPAPVITQPPTNQTVYVGSNVTMTVTATGTGLGYQWRLSNTNLSSATSSFYFIPNAQTNHSGDYTVVVTNAGGGKTSTVATLTVILPPAPTISQHPTNLTVTAGSPANFYVIANGSNLAYQWRRSGTNLPGATATSYSLPNAQLSDAVNYAVVVSNAGGSITSNPAILTVIPAAIGEGSLDPIFNPGLGANNWVNIVLEQPDSRLLIGGLFTTFNNTNRPYVARLNWDGSLDTSFDPGIGPNNALVGLAQQADGKVLIGGFFTTVGAQNFRYVARLLNNGGLDTSFATGTNINGTVRAVAVQTDGKVLVGGDFTSYNTTNRNRIARLNSNGSLDISFNPGTGADNNVNAIVLQPDGRILIGGSFGTVNGTNRASIARLNSDGSLDTTFTNGTGAVFWVNGIALQGDGKILIGGPFTTYNGASRKGIARLNPNGTLDGSFDPGTGTENWVNSVAVQRNGMVSIGGLFTNFNSVNLNHIVRLGTNGLQDLSFSIGSGFNDTIQSLISCADGTLVAGGLFTSYNGTSANRIARLIAAPGAPYPKLRISLAGNSVLLQWPLAAADFHLQANAPLGTAFTNLNTVLSTNGGDISATRPINGSNEFFRLKKP